MNLAQIISLGVLIITIIGLWYQILRSSFSMSVDLTLKLDDKFNSDSFRKQRAKAAKSILKSKFKEAEDVFDFFEMLGCLFDEKLLIKKWHGIPSFIGFTVIGHVLVNILLKNVEIILPFIKISSNFIS